MASGLMRFGLSILISWCGTWLNLSILPNQTLIVEIFYSSWEDTARYHEISGTTWYQSHPTVDLRGVRSVLDNLGVPSTRSLPPRLIFLTRSPNAMSLQLTQVVAWLREIVNTYAYLCNNIRRLKLMITWVRKIIDQGSYRRLRNICTPT